MEAKYKLIGGIIREARFSKRLSQEELARKLGCSKAYISRLEAGSDRPLLVLAFKIEHFFGLKDAPISTEIIRQDYESATGLKHRGEEGRGAGLQNVATLKEVNNVPIGRVVGTIRSEELKGGYLRIE